MIANMNPKSNSADLCTRIPPSHTPSPSAERAYVCTCVCVCLRVQRSSLSFSSQHINDDARIGFI